MNSGPCRTSRRAGRIHPSVTRPGLAAAAAPASFRPMPTRAALVLLVSLLATAAASAQTTPAPATPTPAAPAPKSGKAEAPPEPIDGLEFPRANGGFLGIKLQGVQLKVTFYDKKKEKVAADAARISARWQDNRPRKTVLLPADASTLLSPPVIKAPYSYRIFLVLVGADDRELETLQINPALLPKG